MKLVSDYLRLILFSCGLLMGVQIPAVVDQYAKRVDAHLIEARQNLTGFQQTADQYFNGNIQRLMAHYARSQDPVFQRDAANIRFIHQRVALLNKEAQKLTANPLLGALHVLFRHDPELMAETMQSYSYSILLNPQALIWGLGLAFILALLSEGLLYICVCSLRAGIKRPSSESE